jgi:hypothetical protein
VGEGDKDLTGVPVKSSYPATGKGAHPALWAAFSLSGPGVPAGKGAGREVQQGRAKDKP